MIKDSGNRREFETGAVRDIDESKGRCDLLPMFVIAKITEDDVLPMIGSFQSTGNTMYLKNAIFKFVENEFENMETALLELSIHFKEGAEKYGEYNWQKGIPSHCYIDSAVRHYLKHLRGDVDERHDRAFLWNIICCMWTCDTMIELNEYLKDENKTSVESEDE